jgi:uncharacterized protein
MLPDTVCAQYMDLSRNMYACYADNYNEAVINYNGDVFKCTARDIIHNLNRQLLTHRINTLNENK